MVLPSPGGLSPQVGIDDIILGALVTEPEAGNSTQRKRPVIRRRTTSTASTSSSVPETRSRRNTTSSTDEPPVVVTQSGRKVKTADRFKYEAVPEVEKEESQKLKYYKQIIRAIFHETVLKTKFEEFIHRVYVEGYNDFIKEPMWLEKIQSKLDRKEYLTAEEFEKDFDLMISNCYSFNPACNPENDQIRKCCNRLEEWWTNCKEYYKSWDAKASKHYCYASLLPEGEEEEQEEEDNTLWTTEGIQELLAKLNTIPLGKMEKIITIIRHSEPCELGSIIVQWDFSTFKPSTLNALNKECNKKIAEMKRQEAESAKKSAKSEEAKKKKKARQQLQLEDTVSIAEDATHESAQNELDVNINENRRLSDSEASSESDSSSSDSSSGSSSSEAETESEDEEEQQEKKLTPKTKKKPQLKLAMTSAQPNLSDDSDQEDASTERENQECTSSRLQTGAGPCKRKSDTSEAPSGYTATPPFKKIKESAPRRLDFGSSEGSRAHSGQSVGDQEQTNVLSFGVLKIPVETPEQQLEKLFGVTPKPVVEEELPEISDDRKALRDEAARQRRAAATIPVVHPEADSSEGFETNSFSPAAAGEENDQDYLFQPEFQDREPFTDGNYQMEVTYHGENVDDEEQKQGTASSQQESSLTSEYESMSSKSDIQDNEDSSPAVIQNTVNEANTEATQEDSSESEIDPEDPDCLDYSEC